MGEPGDFIVDVERRSDCVIVHVEGELDLATAGAFEEALSSSAGAEHVILDLSGCTFLDSAGMRVITAAMRTTPRVSVVADDPGVLRVLEITAVDSLISVHPSLDAAL